MKEQNIQNLIRLAVSKFSKTVLFRNNVGMGWVGISSKTADGGVYLKNARPFRAGLPKGSSDLIGWTPKEITPDMVGKTVAIFTAIEVKNAKGRTSKEQDIFIQNVRNSGGIAGVARSESDAVSLINNKIN